MEPPEPSTQPRIFSVSYLLSRSLPASRQRPLTWCMICDDYPFCLRSQLVLR